jgi:carboxymethylenebutenolidase
MTILECTATSSRLGRARVLALTAVLSVFGQNVMSLGDVLPTGTCVVTDGANQARSTSKSIQVTSGNSTLQAWIYRPQGVGRFPAVLVNHGSGRTQEELERLGPYERMAENIGPVFAGHGYVLLYLFRRGVGPSAAAGESAVDLMNESDAHGQKARNALQIKLLEGREMTDALAGLACLRQLPDVDPNRIALIGHSFGGSLTVLMAESDPTLRAAAIFSGAGYSWDRSAELRARLFRAVRHTSVPVFFIHAENDYSTNPGTALDAELARLGKPHRLKIYPAVGRTPEDGHDFPNNSIAAWEPDVFAFLDQYMRN